MSAFLRPETIEHAKHRRKAAAVLGPAGRVTAYKGFVRPVPEYGMLTWMGASQTTLRQLANVQRRALHVIGPGSFLPSLEVRCCSLLSV